MKKITNHLRNSTSPYLLQHVNNPVDWYPWGNEALAKAKKENKPILLSIGYSACHWCHVMAHESFEDEETAQLMNELFVNIKVDREERPDLDKIYQTAHQLLMQRPGGWPLTVFLTPDKQVPFYAGTYFPPRAGFGRPSFKDVLQSVANIYKTQKDEIQKQNESLIQILNRMIPPPTLIDLNLTPVQQAITNITASFDAVNGGFGDAPKFPHPNYLELLLQQYAITHNESLLSMLTFTLTKMAHSGVYDQLGGGFFRYAVDAEWQIPHFEKMLYDNAQLLNIYAQAYALTKIELFAEISAQIGAWVIREMQANTGGFFATLDADSEGKEGKFYVWDKHEIEHSLDPQEYKIITAYFGLDQAPNFEEHYHLHVVRDIPELQQQFNLSSNEIKNIIQTAKEKLLAIRDKRVYPHRDEKILTAWNGLMIKTLALASQCLARKEFLIAAEKSLNFIYKNMWRDSTLMASYKDDKTTIQGYLDDYVFLSDGILAFLQAQWQTSYYDFMLNLLRIILQRFIDKEMGGFFFTADNHEALLYRPKNIVDEAIPAGNGVAALILNRVGYLTGETDYIIAAENILKMAWPSLEHYPDACATLLLALQEFLQPPQIIIIRGKQPDLLEWQQFILKKYSPLRMVFAIENTVKNLPEYLQAKKPQEKTVAYVCKGFECFPPVMNASEL